MIKDFIREFLWALAQAVLMIGDAVYRVTTKVASFNIGELDTVWDYWAVLSVMIGAIAMIRILTIGIKWFFDEQLQEKLNIIKIFGRVILVSLAIGLMPLAVKHLSAFGTGMIDNIGLVTGHGVEMTPSTLIISSVIGDKFEVVNQDGTYEIPKTYQLEDIDDVNHETDGEYTYFKTMGDLFVLMIMGALGVVGLVLIAIEIAERFFRLGIKILIAPLPISALVNPDDDSFSKWAKLVLADVVLNYLQLLSLIFILSVSSSQFIRSQGVWVTLIMFIGGLFAVLKGTPELASIIGGDSSTQGAMQQLATIRQATRGMGAGMVGGAKAVGRTAKKAGQGAKKLGQKVKDFGSSNSDGSQSKGGGSGFGSSSSGETQNSGFSGAEEARNSNRSTVNTSSSSGLSSNDGASRGTSMGTTSSGSSNSGGSQSGGNNFTVEETRNDGAAQQGNDRYSESQGQQFQGAQEVRQPRGGSHAQGGIVSDQQNYASQRKQFDNGKKTGPKPSQVKQDGGNVVSNSSKAKNAINSSLVEKAKGNANKNKFARSGSASGKHVYQKSDNRIKQSMPSRTGAAYKNALKDNKTETVERGVG